MISKIEITPDCITEVAYAIVADGISEVSALNEDTDNEITVVFVGQNAWKNFYATLLTAELTEDTDATEAGNLFEQTAKLVFPGDDSSSRKSIAALEQKAVLLKLTYANGTSKIIGSIERPAYMLPKFSSKSYDTYKEITFKAKSPFTAKFLA
jgi:hypothetical protein